MAKKTKRKTTVAKKTAGTKAFTIKVPMALANRLGKKATEEKVRGGAKSLAMKAIKNAAG